MSEAVHTTGQAAARPPQRGASGEDRGAVPVAIAVGASFEGLLSCPRPTRIDGRLRGDVMAAESVELGEHSDVVGRVEARDIVIAGHFEGELVATGTIELLPSARVEGNLRARELSAHEGCVVTGQCRTGPAAFPND